MKADPIPWLLESDGSPEPSSRASRLSSTKSQAEGLAEVNPSVRYWTLRDLLDRSEDDAEVQAARAAVVRSDVVQRLLAAQHPDGYWGRDPRQPYGAARTTAHLVVLAELGVPVNDRLRRGCEYFLEASQQPDDGITYGLFKPVGEEERALLAGEIQRLEGLLGGEFLLPRTHTPFTRALK